MPVTPTKPRQCEVYTDRISYSEGDTVQLHVSTRAATFDLRIVRDGLAPEEVHVQRAVQGRYHETPADAFACGCGWPVACTFQIPVGFRSGFYIVLCNANAPQPDHAPGEHFFVVTPSAAEAQEADLVIVCATNSWNSYNYWGGANHYAGTPEPTPPKSKGLLMGSPRLSIHRPISPGVVSLPPDFLRVAMATSPPLNWKLEYPTSKYARQHGLSWYYFSAGWAMYERHFVVWAERAGYKIAYLTQMDIHWAQVRGVPLLAPYKCAVFVGHDEYWSWEMRDAVDAYLDNGGHCARFAGNFFWQVRLEGEAGEVQVCYKYTAQEADPILSGPSPQPHLLTSVWEDQKVDRPGVLTFGLNGSQGVYGSFGGCAPRHHGGFTCFEPEHWAFSGTDLYYGDVIGAGVPIFGYECDGLDFTFEDGKPCPTGHDGCPRDRVKILAMAVCCNWEENYFDRGGLWVGEGDARMLAKAVYGDDSEDNLKKTKYGSGMIVEYTRGEKGGSVFHAGSTDWVAGLQKGEAFTMAITKNVIDRFIGRPLSTTPVKGRGAAGAISFDSASKL